MASVRAFIRRMTRLYPTAFALTGVAVLVAVIVLVLDVNIGAPMTVTGVEPIDSQMIPASGVPPEDGGQADVIPPDEGGDDAGAAPQGTTTTTPPAP